MQFWLWERLQWISNFSGTWLGILLPFSFYAPISSHQYASPLFFLFLTLNFCHLSPLIPTLFFSSSLVFLMLTFFYYSTGIFFKSMFLFNLDNFLLTRHPHPLPVTPLFPSRCSNLYSFITIIVPLFFSSQVHSFISQSHFFFFTSSYKASVHPFIHSSVISFPSFPVYIASSLPLPLLNPSFSRHPIVNLFIFFFLFALSLSNLSRCALFYLSPWRDPPSVY